MFTYGGPQIQLKPTTVASSVFEARHFVLKFMQISHEKPHFLFVVLRAKIF